LRWIRSTTIFELFKAVKIYFKLRKQDQWMANRFNEINPHLAISNGDRHGGLEPAFLKQATKYSIKIIVPYFSNSGIQGPLKTQLGRRLVERTWKSPLITHLLYYTMGHQFYNKKYLFFDPSMTLALKLFGTLSNYPWQIGAGLVTNVCVDSQNTWNRYHLNGLDKEKLNLVGETNHPDIYRGFKNKDEIKAKILGKYGMASEKKCIICSLPQLYEHGFADEATHWEEMNFLTKSLSEHCNLLISLHPKMNRNSYVFLEKKFGVRILNEPLKNVIAIADLFVATFSSTIYWSILCEVPSIVVDFYGFNYDAFDFFSSIDIVKEKTALSEIVFKKLHSKTDFQNDWKELSRDVIFNDQTINRYFKLIQNEQNL
ncbi:MAG: hypothetical protein VW397_05730, partial [Candidatus Margulisiibacteriota bacterium]